MWTLHICELSLRIGQRNWSSRKRRGIRLPKYRAGRGYSMINERSAHLYESLHSRSARGWHTCRYRRGPLDRVGGGGVVVWLLFVLLRPIVLILAVKYLLTVLHRESVIIVVDSSSLTMRTSSPLLVSLVAYFRGQLVFRWQRDNQTIAKTSRYASDVTNT